MIENLEKSLADKDLVQASILLDKFYKGWDGLNEEDQAQIKDLEPIYLTLVQADIQAHKSGRVS